MVRDTVSTSTLVGVAPDGAARAAGVARSAEPDVPRVGTSGGGAGGAPLGSTQSYCSHGVGSSRNGHGEDGGFGEARRRARWLARAALWQASTLKPVRCCGRHAAAVVDEDGVPVQRAAVEVRRHEVEGGAVAGYGGLYACGSVWACPRCASVVAWERSAEVAAAVEATQEAGGSVHFLTLTLRHTASDELAELFDALTSGWRAVTGTYAWTGDARHFGDRERFQVAGTVRVVEATVSRPGAGGTGWHVHVHCLLFCAAPDLGVGLRPDVEDVLARLTGYAAPVDRAWLGRVALASRVWERWARGVRAAGGRAPGYAAVDLRTVHDGGAAFIGGYLEKATYDVAAEVAAGDQTKGGRRDRLTPFGLLHELLTDQDSPRFGLRTPREWQIVETDSGLELLDGGTGEVMPISSPGAWALWHSWEQVTRGRRRVRWSNRPRAAASDLDVFWAFVLDARGREESDEEIARGSSFGEVLGDIPREVWSRYLVWRPSWLLDILRVAERDGAEGVRSWMDTHDLAYASR